MTWYVAMLILRNCGRFLNLASDFGSSYKTHTFVSSEALYAGMTREMSGGVWLPDTIFFRQLIIRTNPF